MNHIRQIITNQKIAPHCVSNPDDVCVQSERPIQCAFYDSLTYL